MSELRSDASARRAWIRSRISRVSRSRVSSRARRRRSVVFPRVVRCVRARVRARSARCSAPSSSPRIGPAIRSSEGSVLGANRRAQRERDTVSAGTGYGDAPRLPAARIKEYLAESPSGASGRSRRGGELVRMAAEADAACITSGTVRRLCSASVRDIGADIQCARDVSHEPAACGPPSSPLPTVSPVPWCGRPSLPRASDSWPFGSVRCCVPDEPGPLMRRHAALLVSAPCGPPATWSPKAVWKRRFVPWRGRARPGGAPAWARGAELRPSLLHAVLWTGRSLLPASQSELRVSPRGCARSLRARTHRPAWRPIYPGVCLSLRGRWLLCPACDLSRARLWIERRLLHS